MNTEKKFYLRAEFEYCPKDSGALNSERTPSYALKCDALSAAETLWKSGHYERVYVADNEPIWRKEFPFLLWLKHRATKWIVLHDGPTQLLIPRRPLAPNLLWRIPVNEACAVIDTHKVAPQPLEVSDTFLGEVLQMIWDFHNKINLLMACETRLYFEGLKVGGTRADVLFREDIL